jgi:acetylornithine deacetylase/succinyl-diaminopimelate desuccinylase-like protein
MFRRDALRRSIRCGRCGGSRAPNVVPDRTAANFYIRYPDEVYLVQVREFVDNAARAARRCSAKEDSRHLLKA